MGGIRRSAVASRLGLAILLSLSLTASPAQASSGSEHVRVGVEVLDFDPLMDGGQPLTVARGWNDPAGLQPQYISDIATASGGIVKQKVVHVTVVRDYPVKSGGFHFTNETYQSCFVEDPPRYCTALIDYGAVLNATFNPRVKSACEALRSGRVDEIWLWGGPWFGYLEWRLVTPQSLCPAVRKPFAVMGFSYERGEPEMVHDLHHRDQFQHLGWNATGIHRLVARPVSAASWKVGGHRAGLVALRLLRIPLRNPGIALSTTVCHLRRYGRRATTRTRW